MGNGPLSGSVCPPFGGGCDVYLVLMGLVKTEPSN